jgi:hypothetical protein
MGGKPPIELQIDGTVEEAPGGILYVSQRRSLFESVDKSTRRIAVYLSEEMKERDYKAGCSVTLRLTLDLKD